MFAISVSERILLTTIYSEIVLQNKLLSYVGILPTKYYKFKMLRYPGFPGKEFKFLETLKAVLTKKK